MSEKKYCELFKKLRSNISIAALSGETGMKEKEIESLFNHIENILNASERKATKLIIHTDGAARGNPGPAGLGVIIQDEAGRTLAELSEFLGNVTNNVAEYRALERGLEKALKLGASSVLIKTDSELLTKQIEGFYRVRNKTLIPLHQKCKDLMAGLSEYEIVHIPRAQNKRADVLANNAIDKASRR